ncbi:Uncharacterized protein dnm_055220 [Desulfonema magnum]|uniref:Uncharacterized protein n=1 Tax=Desulfonema magnum TaxID=45655 RepID=A0A975BPX1_9BACT|nr:Uncharacterized protein dnm_055220 [Desulfonema magnum]
MPPPQGVTGLPKIRYNQENNCPENVRIGFQTGILFFRDFLKGMRFDIRLDNI